MLTMWVLWINIAFYTWVMSTIADLPGKIVGAVFVLINVAGAAKYWSML